MKLNGFAFKQAKNYTKGRIKPVQLIVLHSMESPERVNTAENVAAYFAGANAPKASAHFCVDADSIIQSVRLEDTAWHCKNANANGVGIEHAGYAKQTKDEWLDAYGQAMLELSAELTAALCSRYNIPARRAVFASKTDPRVISPGICGHADVPAHGSHWDPGPHFPFDYYLERVKFYLDSSLSGVAATNDDIQLPASSSPLPVEVPPLPEETPAPSQQADAGAAPPSTPLPVVDPNAPPIQASQGGMKSLWTTLTTGAAAIPATIIGLIQGNVDVIKWAVVIIGVLGALYLLRQTILDVIRMWAASDQTRNQVK